MNYSKRKPLFDPEKVKQALGKRIKPGTVFEYRAVDATLDNDRREGIVYGYFDSADALTKELPRVSSAKGQYITANPVDPKLHHRAFDKLKRGQKGDGTADKNIIRRVRLIVDVDPDRPANISATDAEHQAALELTAKIRGERSADGWPEPLYEDSGNGGRLNYAIDLPADDGDLVKRCIEALAARYNGNGLSVDITVHSAAQIDKLPGTLCCKGDDTPERPHRMADIIDAPAVVEVVPVELLERLANSAPQPTHVPPRHNGDGRNGNRAFNLEEWIAEHCPDARPPKRTADGEVWVLPTCVWDSSHTGGCAHIIRRSDGSIGAACKHNSCSGKGWRDLRDTVEPDWRNRQRIPNTIATSPIKLRSTEWQDPRALPAELSPVVPFKFDLLPDVFRAWIADIAERMQCPPDFPAVASMVVAAGLLGRRVGIRPKRYDDWLVVANLWAMVIGRPGIMKTPAITEPINVLKRLEIAAKDEYVAELRDFNAAQIVAKVRQKACETEIKNDLKKGGDGMAIATSVVDADTNEPTRRRYLVNDTSVEKLGEILGDNPNGVTVFRDELVGLLKSLEKEGQEGARAFYLEAWNGTGRYTYDRISRGTIDIDAAIVSILGGIQPSRLSEYLRAAVQGGTGDDGLMQRYQLSVWPDVSGEWVNIDRWPETAAKKAAFEAYMRLEAIDPSDIGAESDRFGDGIPFLHFSAAAQERFDNWRSELEARLRSGDEHPAIESHLSKFRSLIPSLALLLHLVDVGRGPVGVEVIEKAIRWGQYLESHARRIYGAAVHAEVPAAKALAKRILSGTQIGDVAGEFTLRDIYRNAWAGLSTKEEAQAAVELLIELDWLRLEERSTGGKPKGVFHINPKIWRKAPGGTDKTDKSPPNSPEGTPFVSFVSSAPSTCPDFEVASAVACRDVTDQIDPNEDRDEVAEWMG